VVVGAVVVVPSTVVVGWRVVVAPNGTGTVGRGHGAVADAGSLPLTAKQDSPSTSIRNVI
jgi:hypothetical protein